MPRKPRHQTAPTPTSASQAAGVTPQPLNFAFGRCWGSNDHEVRPKAGATDLIDAMSARQLGLDPPDFFAQPELTDGGRLLVGRCDCGVMGCGDLGAFVEICGDEVRWQLGPTLLFTFDRVDYLRAVQAARDDTSWESLERTAERLVMGLNFSAGAKDGYRFQWASARIKRNVMALSFDKKGAQVMFEVSWNGTSPAHAAAQVQRWINDKARFLK